MGTQLKCIYLLLIFFLSNAKYSYSGSIYNQNSCELSNRQCNNLMVYSKIYGIVRFFYPSKQAKNINWHKMAVYGVQRVENAKDKTELIQILNEIFLPIVPNLKLSSDSLLKNIGEIKKNNDRIYYWEHSGCGLESKKSIPFIAKPYSSVLKSYKDDEKDTIQKLPHPLKPLNFSIGQGINCMMPIAVFAEKNTPRSFQLLNKEVEDINIEKKQFANVQLRSHRIASIIIAWNVIQHFYPYDDLDRKVWRDQLFQSINRASADKNLEDFYYTLSNLLSKVNDGHISVSDTYSTMGGLVAHQKQFYFAGVELDMVQNKLIVTATEEKYKDIMQVGDAVIGVNGIPIEEVLQKKASYISASSLQQKQIKINESFFRSYKKDSLIKLSIFCNNETKEVFVKTDRFRRFYKSDTATFIKELQHGVYYVNLNSDEANLKEFEKRIKDFVKAKGLIIDIRGYPPYFTNQLLGYFTDTVLHSTNFSTPIVAYPNFEKVDFRSSSWTIKPQKKQIKCKKIFLTNENAMSYAETIMDFISYYKMGDIVGTPTAGCNGDIAMIELPIFSFWFTGLVVKNYDGTIHHGKGIPPTYLISPTIEGLVSHRDEVLEKAIECILK